MRNAIKRSLAGLVILGAGVVGAQAAGGNANGPDAFIGIVGGSPQPYAFSPDNPHQRGYEPNDGQGRPYGYRAQGVYNGGHYNGN